MSNPHDANGEKPVNADGNIEFRRQESLLKTGALQDAIFNSANFSSIATDEKGVIQIFNVGAERMLGYIAADVVNKITPADISDPRELITRAAILSLELDTAITPGFAALVFKASRGIEDIYELTYIRKDGSRFPAIVSVTALRDAQEDIIGYLLIGTDNTARKHVEAQQALLDQRLRDQQFYTRSLIESNMDALMTTDPQGIISDVNQQMVALTGRTRDELIGAPCKNFFTDPIRADAAIKRVLAENKVSNYELTVRAFNGEEIVVSYNAATFHDRDRKLQGVFAAARDITERKHFERALQEKNIELERASRMKSEFLATMSHELRTPLNAIIGFSEALKDGLMGDMSGAQQEYIGDIFTSGQHLLSLINDILDLSKVEAGMMNLELEAVDLHALLANSLSIVREKAAARSIRLELEISTDLRVLLMDMRKTKQIVYNLLSNAVKFSANGGCVNLLARPVARAAVGVIAGDWSIHKFAFAEDSDMDFLEISVCDSGIGISQLAMTKLFQAFSQIDSSLARKFEGTGLGLAMVKQLAELHGGTVAVASAEGVGARFVVWLPLRGVAQSDIGGVNKALGKGAPMALIIESDDATADVLRALLEEDGYFVMRGASTHVALSMLTQQLPDLIILNYQADASTWEFLRQIGGNVLLTQVLVVLFAGPEDANLALSFGAVAMLQKPVNGLQLRDTIAKFSLNTAQSHIHRILLVDDDPKALELLAALLPSQNYTIVRAHGGTEAIAIAQSSQPDLIILDLVMPEVSGVEVIQALRARSETARIPVVIVTAASVTAQSRSALGEKFDGFIHIMQKTDFQRGSFIAEVRRARKQRPPLQD